MTLKSFSRNLWFLIPAVGMLIVIMFLIGYGKIPYKSPLPVLIIHGIVMTAGIWTGCIVIVSWLWRRFPWEESPVIHLLLEILLISVYTLAFGGGLYLMEKKFFGMPELRSPRVEILVTLLITYFITTINEAVFFYRQWIFNFSKSLRLERDNIRARYENLRAQINPHFLFNSLNSLITMANDNAELTGYIKDLSDLLRYSLQSGEKHIVLLHDETELIRKYVSVQQKRFQQNLFVDIDIPEKYHHYAVPPLVLQMLVENCIKHNVISATQPLRISITANEESITVSNNLQKKEAAEATGTGLDNIRGRYMLLTRREIEIKNDGNTFSVTVPLLKLDL